MRLVFLDTWLKPMRVAKPPHGQLPSNKGARRTKGLLMNNSRPGNIGRQQIGLGRREALSFQKAGHSENVIPTLSLSKLLKSFGSSPSPTLQAVFFPPDPQPVQLCSLSLPQGANWVKCPQKMGCFRSSWNDRITTASRYRSLMLMFNKWGRTGQPH